jgi:hypothetical protein
MFAHPFHGSLYFSAARTNGFNYWASVPFAIAGSFLWECCGETHPPSINDWIATSIGGAAIGETTYRLSSTCSTILPPAPGGPGARSARC